MELKYSDILNNQPIFNIGSIGHVAHGKSTLVKSMTGIKTQKFSSEQERNITIHIGYANTKIFMDKYHNLHTVPSKHESLIDDEGNQMILVGHISFVDVPGHEAFMSNMISGAAVMDACILVIASNETIPQPQTYEHFQAVRNLNIKDFIILQNKLDLVEESSNEKILDNIQKFIQNSVAENATIIPSSIQNNINKNEILKTILNLSNEKNIKILNEKVNEDLKMIIIRSFDINKPNTTYDMIEGGVVGGSLISGNLKIGDYIEMRPGFIIDNKYRPIYSRVKSLQSDTKKLNYALPGGLIGICLDIDPSLTKSNEMVGQILGHIGKMPEVYDEIFMSFDEISRFNNSIEKIKTNDDVLLSINSMNIKAKVTKCKNKKNLISFKLLTPVCIFEKQKIAIFKLKCANWILYATGTFLDGIECERYNIEKKVYSDLVDKNINNHITIINDFDDIKFNLKPYNEIVQNIIFKNNTASNINIHPPIVKKINRDSVYLNYNVLLDAINKTAKEITYNNIFLEFLKEETSTTCDINKQGIAIRGNFRNTHIQNIIIKFYKKYKICNICKSQDSFLLKENRRLFKKCINCNSQSCI
jgi:translation initiation factor 2 subunit 3